MKMSGSVIDRIFSPAVELPSLRQIMEHKRAEATDRAFLDRDDDLVLTHQAGDEVGIERLGEARVSDRGREPVGAELLRRLEAFLQARTKAQKCDRRAFLDDAAASDLQRDALFRHFDADPVAARKAQRRGRVIDRHRGRDHVHKLDLVGRGHQHEARQVAEIADIERTGMGLPVISDKTGAIDGETHRQLLDRDVVDDLVIGALKEGGVDRRERLHPFAGEARGKRHPVLLGDADIEGAVRKFVAEKIKAGARRHRRGDRDDLVVGLGLLDQRFGEDAGIGRRLRR